MKYPTFPSSQDLSRFSAIFDILKIGNFPFYYVKSRSCTFLTSSQLVVEQLNFFMAKSVAKGCTKLEPRDQMRQKIEKIMKKYQK